ncbi:MAG: nucleoside recognition domain-containing protein [Oscillospiraceae bacterium]|nr:nucleoside recognition domain-containing protein [Oscillospiraceae bacterium]
MMNYVFPILLVLSFAAAAVQGRMGELSAAVIQGGQDAVSLLLRLASMLCLWGGVMEIAEKSGITRMMAKLLSPLLKLIFPSLRKEKYAMEAISMNVTANILGLGNAATPLGLEAMRRLQEINGEKSTASDEMIVFVVMNTAAMHIIPTTVATLRGQYGSTDPMEIMPASILTSVCALTIAVVVAKLGNVLYRRLPRREAKGGRRLSAVGSKGL